MKSELSFLLDLFLLPDISVTMRDMLVERIRQVEMNVTMSLSKMVQSAPTFNQNSGYVVNAGPQQAPSTLAAIARHEGHVMAAIPTPAPPPVPVAVIAQTPAAAAAMQSRQDAIAASLSGKVDKSSGRPRKF